MTQTAIQRTFAPIKKHFPKWLANPLRNIGTALLTPVMYSYRTGHFLSSLRMVAVSKHGEPLPWYTYPSIDFLKYRDYRGKKILEFGGGQSTVWWAARADTVVTFEGDFHWYEKIKDKMPNHVELHFVSMENKEENILNIHEILRSKPYSKYDVIVIDGLHRYEMIEVASNVLAEDGIVVCDNSEGYGFFDGFRARGLMRVDFYGNAPGVILPHCTSIYFGPNAFVFDPHIPIHVIARE